MDDSNLNRERNKAERRKQSPFAWIIGWFFFVLLVGVLVFYFVFPNKFNQVTGSDGSTRPNVTQPAK